MRRWQLQLFARRYNTRCLCSRSADVDHLFAFSDTLDLEHSAFLVLSTVLLRCQQIIFTCEFPEENWVIRWTVTVRSGPGTMSCLPILFPKTRFHWFFQYVTLFTFYTSALQRSQFFTFLFSNLVLFSICCAQLERFRWPKEAQIYSTPFGAPGSTISVSSSISRLKWMVKEFGQTF